MKDTRREATWYTEGWFVAGDEIVVHITNNKPPVEDPLRQPISLREEQRFRWWMICPRPDESCVVCDKGDELLRFEESIGCGCYTTCGQVCDDCVDLTKYLEETK